MPISIIGMKERPQREAGAKVKCKIGFWPVPGHSRGLMRRVKSGVIFPYKKILTKMVNEHNLINRCRLLQNTVQK